MPVWLIFVRDLALIVCWELLKSGSRQIKKNRR